MHDRSVVVSTFVTLDGYMVGPDEDGSWVVADFDREMQADIAEDMSRKSDLFVFGRVTYEIFAAYWPTAVPYEEDDDLKPAEGKEDLRNIRAINDFPKVEFSRTLKTPGWNNSALINGNLAQELDRLKRQPGKDIGVSGSPSLVRSLLQDGLLDELRLAVHPVVAGRGKRLFGDGDDLKRLKLAEVKPTRTGVVVLTYRPADA
jgi:dihydrofolate reductase